MPTEEHKRLNSAMNGPVHPWKKWGTYVSERQWGTVREDYSADGNAWNYLPHDMARSKAYRWGEDGLAGFCDRYQLLVFSLAVWNGHDPILKERLFGLTPFEGNHGEDVKELYYYLDATPTHSYMKYLYKYPHQAFPYDELVEQNRKRTPRDREYELIDTGIFEDNRYFDIYIEYAKAGPDDICIRVEVFNRGSESASIHLIPQIWFRNRWECSKDPKPIPFIAKGPVGEHFQSLVADCSEFPSPERVPEDYRLANQFLYGSSEADLLFTNNETNNPRVWGGWAKNNTPYVKDAFHRQIVNNINCVNPDQKGSKACFHYKNLKVEPGKSVVIKLRLTPEKIKDPLKDVDTVVALRKKEADEFYAAVQSGQMTDDEKLIQRQAFAGMIWTQQFYTYNVNQWLKGDDPEAPPPASRLHIRNAHWRHFYADDIISMPDKWEYPWFASWDLAFHTVTLGLLDREFAKQQMFLLLTHLYQHPNGQIPAYEWGFSDLNPPVQAWAVWKLYQMEVKEKKTGDREFLETCFHKLTYNFAWWVNVVDKMGNNFFEGGFLGMDNISIIDRSHPLPGGGHIEQSDGTGWMGFFSLIMMRMSLELAKTDDTYRVMATVFFENFVYISAAMAATDARPIHMWDDQDGFFYDIIAFPNKTHQKLRVRSLVGLVPFYSLDVIYEDELDRFPMFENNFNMFLREKSNLTDRCITPITVKGRKGYLLSLMRPEQMKRVLGYVWSQDEFRSPFGLRSLSKYHEKHPFIYEGSRVDYEPGEAIVQIKGGNSNWRGPIWFPTAYLMVDSLRKLHSALGDGFKVGAPEESAVTLSQLADTLSEGLISIFRKDKNGRRPVHGEGKYYNSDPHWQDLVLFYEHYHGDTGRGLGASHQTGWSGLVASLLKER